MPERIIIHVDMNSYFASVEQQANPSLRGRPVGVCAYLHPHGCVIAASVEAKQRGVKVGMTVDQAREACKETIFVQNDPTKYRTVTSRFFKILHELSDTIEHYSIDEAFVDLTGWVRDEAEAAFLASRVKYRLTNEVGDWLRCSVGIAPTRFLAKFGSDRKKPDGLTIVNASNIDDHLSRVSLEDLCGIGPRLRRRLHQYGIRTPLELKYHPIGNLMRLLGKNGFYWWSRLHAMECETLSLGDALPKSVGHSYCVPNRVNREGNVEAVLTKLVERAGRRLRAYGLLAESVSISVGLRRSGEDIGDWVRFDQPADDSFSIVRYVSRLLHSVWHGEPVSFLAVTLGELSLPDGQMRFGDLLEPASGAHDAPGLRDPGILRVSKSVDLIRDRYGDASIVFGRMFRLGDEAPDRIGFRKIVGAGYEG
jgi:DNA polymerase-4